MQLPEENKKNKRTDNDAPPLLLGQKQSHEAVFMSLAKKAEKLSIALYMVTDLIPESDPIRHTIRNSSIDLISGTRQMSYAFSGDVYFVIAKTIHTAWGIISLIEVSASVGFISDMNAKVLRSVLIEFIAALRDKQRRESYSDLGDMKIGESFGDQIMLSKELFHVPEESASYKGQNIKDKEMSFIKPPRPHNVSVPVRSLAPTSLVPKKTDRREKIIEIIKQKGEVTIGDITISFPDISSKTIQRELIVLTEEGVLRKEGDKRWSKYSLAV